MDPDKLTDTSSKIPPGGDFSAIDLDMQYDPKRSQVVADSTQVKKEMDKTKKELDKLKNWILKKYPSTQAVSILAPQYIKLFIDEEEIPKDTEKFLHLYMIVPETEFKNIPKMKKEIVAEIDKNKIKLKEKVWLQIKTPVDLWENSLDSRFNLNAGIAMSYPLFDTGFLGLLRMVEIHKSLILQKFDKYVVSYVIAGSFIRGEATETSDADVFVIINDTDVKRMPRLELKERLRNMIHQYISEAAALAGVKNTLHVQTYLLTEFWDGVKDANPVFFTFVRDGVPVFDKGTFLPWKALLRMGKLKPSPEAIDLFMKGSEKTKDMVDRRLLDAMIDVYYGVLNPSQALMMLYGEPTPAPKHAHKVMEDIFVKKEKMLTKADLAILDKSIKLFKEYEHDLKFTVAGKEVDQLVKDAEVYFKKMKELRKKIEKRAQEKTLDQLHKDIFDILKIILGSKSQEALISAFEKELVKSGKFTSQHVKILQRVIDTRKEFKKGKASTHKIDQTRRDAVTLINDLIEYNQRCDLASLQKNKMAIKYKEGNSDKVAEMILSDSGAFLFRDGKVYEIGSKLIESNMQEVSKSLGSQDLKKQVSVDPKIFETLKKELGEFEIIL